MRSNSGQDRRNSRYSSSVQNPITRSTPARLYQPPVEEDDLARRWQMRDVPLEVPLRLFPARRLGQCGHAADAGIEPRDDAGDGAALAGGVAALEDDHHLPAMFDHPFLELGQLDLQAGQFLFVVFLFKFLLRFLLLGFRMMLAGFTHARSSPSSGP